MNGTRLWGKEPVSVSLGGRERLARLLRRAFSFTLLLVLVLVHGACTRTEAPIVVVPGRSIAGLELGMNRGAVIAALGRPAREVAPEDVTRVLRFEVLGGGGLRGEVPPMTLLMYTNPPVVIWLLQEGSVGSVQLNYSERVRVEGYDFLTFRYLTKEHVERLGKPRSVIRDHDSEQHLLSKAPPGTQLEYYVYEYDRLKLTLGLVFDRTRERSSPHFIALNYILLSAQRELSSTR